MFEVGKKYTATFAKDKVFECLKVGKETALVQNVEWEQDVMVPPLKQLTRGVWKEYKEPRTITRWVNVWESNGTLLMGKTYYSKEEAMDNVSNAIATIPITYTEPH